MSDRSKIARLPLAIREELNHRLLSGQPGPQILPWLNSLPEAQQVIAEFTSAGGKEVGPFDDKNLSTWRRGSYARWLSRRERLAEQKEMAAYSMKLAKAAGGDMAAGPSALVAGELLDLMETLRDLRESANDPSDPSAQSYRLQSLAKAIDSAAKAINTIRSGDHNAAKLDLDRRKLAQADESLKLERIRLNAVLDKAAQRLLDETFRQQATSIANSNMSNADKIAAMRAAAFADVDALEKSGAVHLPA
jgi:hypothetical protein